MLVSQFPKRRGSSVVEQKLEELCVVSSILTRGTTTQTTHRIIINNVIENDDT